MRNTFYGNNTWIIFTLIMAFCLGLSTGCSSLDTQIYKHNISVTKKENGIYYIGVDYNHDGVYIPKGRYTDKEEQ